MFSPSGIARYAMDATTRARFETRFFKRRAIPIEPIGIEKMSARRGRIPMRPKTNVPAKPRTP